MYCKILIVDDHFVVREGLKLILETEEKYEVIGEAANGNEALRFMESSIPDLVLMDLYMPQMNGLETMETMIERGIDIPVVILTTYNEDEWMMRGLSLGAKGYLLKDTGREHLFRTIDAALRGETLLQQDILSRVMAVQRERLKPAANRKSQELTDKELQVLQAAAEGLRSKEIAVQLSVSERTVKAHLTSVYNKLGVDSRSQAVAVAVERGWVKP
ncbi:response regulator transcription factor [Paenibacillus pasadenensis]|uniref:response regulator n=1 Tax=Paenibacillus pasadenensis TaxID=217090 RepID=UPI00203D55C5|nr:response regulator transcription factor [Paenibacillus pasadenensis]MCM3748852.1 response regulator transcription factor [Paenibacillus pasadenensis]